jgi:glycosyltransferase involved in cell wall biosynthesis
MSRIAVLHEWVDSYAGSEQVFEAIAQMFPAADLFALSYEPRVLLDLAGRDVRTTFLDHALLRGRRSVTLPLMPAAWRALGKGRYDVVVSSHHAFAHTNRLAEGGAHLCYVHTPARYVWSPEIDARGDAWYLAPARALLRRADLAASRRVTVYAANSSAVAQRIEKFWGRESTVIFPPVRVEYFSAPASTEAKRDYIFGVGRWIPYKNLHLVIEAADLAGMPVKIAGRGPDNSRILAAAERATVPVELIESPTHDRLRELYRNAACLMFPAVEDFGIVPVESQAAGTPVIAIAAGGALDTVQPDVSGVLLEGEPSAQRLAECVPAALRLQPADCQQNASRFSRSAFNRNIAAWAAPMIEG